MAVHVLDNSVAGISLGDELSIGVVEKVVDFDSISGLASGDTVKAIPVKAGFRCLFTELEIVTPANSATSATADVGDSADADGFDASVNLKGSAGTIATTSSADAYFGVGSRYTDDDYITVTPTFTGATTVYGKVKLRAFLVKMKKEAADSYA